MLSHEIELEETPEITSKSRDVVMLSLLALLMFTLFEFELFLPLPTGVVSLYLFKDFKRLAGRALLCANVLNLLCVVFIFNVLFITLLLYGLLTDVLYVGVYNRNNFIFHRRAMFEMGVANAAPLLIFVLPILETNPHIAGFVYELPWIWVVLSQVVIVGIVLITIGGTFMYVFKIILNGLGNRFRVNELRWML